MNISINLIGFTTNTFWDLFFLRNWQSTQSLYIYHLWIFGEHRFVLHAEFEGAFTVAMLYSACPQVTSYAMSKEYQLLAASGPTYDQVAAFQWSTSPYSGLLHVGHPDRWAFPTVFIHWGWTVPYHTTISTLRFLPESPEGNETVTVGK